MPKDSPARIECLDGLRAISITAVLAAHALGTGLPDWQYGDVLAANGVATFFVISGFLITTLLLRERDKHGRISLRGFYLRRAFRIFPAFYTFLAVVAVLAAAGAITLGRGDFAFAATYTMNFHADRAWWVGHLWSLAVEEQFYLMWPVTLVVLGVRRAAYVAAAAIVLAPILRVFGGHVWPAVSPLTDQAFPFVFDKIAIGCLLAIARPRLERHAGYLRLLRSEWFWFVPLACVASTAVTQPWFNLGPATSAANVGIALAIHRCVLDPDRLAGRVLERPGFVFVGTLSYSLYLWQQLFLNRHASAWWCKFPANVAFAVAAATASYYLIERPALKLGRRFR